MATTQAANGFLFPFKHAKQMPIQEPTHKGTNCTSTTAVSYMNFVSMTVKYKLAPTSRP